MLTSPGLDWFDDEADARPESHEPPPLYFRRPGRAIVGLQAPKPHRKPPPKPHRTPTLRQLLSHPYFRPVEGFQLKDVQAAYRSYCADAGGAAAEDAVAAAEEAAAPTPAA